MSDSIRSRFDRYSPDHLDEIDLKARAIRAGRSLAAQAHHEDQVAEQSWLDAQARVVAEHRAKERAMGGVTGPQTYEDRFGNPQWTDPADEGNRRSWH